MDGVIDRTIFESPSFINVLFIYFHIRRRKRDDEGTPSPRTPRLSRKSYSNRFFPTVTSNDTQNFERTDLTSMIKIETESNRHTDTLR